MGVLAAVYFSIVAVEEPTHTVQSLQERTGNRRNTPTGSIYFYHHI